jgi:hypothetical protein
MGVWLPDGWMESAPAGFPLPPLIPPGPLLSPLRGEKGGREWGLGAAAKPPPLPALRSGSGEGAGSQVSVFVIEVSTPGPRDARGRLGGGASPPKNPFFSSFPAL